MTPVTNGDPHGPWDVGHASRNGISHCDLVREIEDVEVPATDEEGDPLTTLENEMSSLLSDILSTV